MGMRGDGVNRCIESAKGVLRVHDLQNTRGWITTVNEDIPKLTAKGFAFLMGADDMIFHKGSIELAVEAMNERFPDEDGVIGFNQSNLITHCEAGFTLIGRKFLKRFEGQFLFCPDYQHYYADTELLRYAETAGKFYYCEEARVDHYHFSVYGQKKDSTALKSQMSRDIDIQTALNRDNQGLLWGHDFRRVV